MLPASQLEPQGNGQMVRPDAPYKNTLLCLSFVQLKNKVLLLIIFLLLLANIAFTVSTAAWHYSGEPSASRWVTVHNIISVAKIKGILST